MAGTRTRRELATCNGKHLRALTGTEGRRGEGYLAVKHQTVSVTLNLNLDTVAVAVASQAVVTVVLSDIRYLATSVVANIYHCNVNQSVTLVEIKIVTAGGGGGNLRKSRNHDSKV